MINHIGAVYSGMGPDFRIITKKAQKKANTYYATYGVSIINKNN